ncbi:hypothetical protein MGALJ_42980 [Mycobacterium gallinarum]|uniref:Uncharacterized protein n=1 Tax=Mycobacterium gallinarum TaxID=39689 RepID=A0A9W4FH21_9MYCO|nr:hypothetical protein MGALJ_42980 [Mycobacterium gallinarum]
MASIQPCSSGISGTTSQWVNQLERKTMSRSPGAEARYATCKSPFIAYRVSENTGEA